VNLNVELSLPPFFMHTLFRYPRALLCAGLLFLTPRLRSRTRSFFTQCGWHRQSHQAGIYGNGTGSNQIADGKCVGARRWRAYRSSSSDIPFLSVLSVFISSTQLQKTLKVTSLTRAVQTLCRCQLILKVGVPYNPQFPTGGFGCG